MSKEINILSEKEFLLKLKQEINEIEFGEGISFNIRFLEETINKRIQEVNNNSKFKQHYNTHK